MISSSQSSISQSSGSQSSGSQRSIEPLLLQLQDASTVPDEWGLSVLSDLSLDELQRLQAVWPQIPEGRRLLVVRSLVEESADNLHLQLGRLLRLALTDPLAEVRVEAIKGLWEETGPDLVGPLVRLLGNDPDQTVRAAAAEALGAYVLAGEVDELSSALAIRVEDALLGVLHDEMEPIEVQAAALESIAFSGETGVRELIEDGYYSPYEEMRVAALHAMGHSADIRWRGLAAAELDSPSAPMRAAAARACGELENRDALEGLIDLLSDEEKSVRLAGIFALGRLGGKRAGEALEAMSASDDPDEAEAADVALEESIFYGDAQDIPLFDETAPDWDDADWDDADWDDADWDDTDNEWEDW